MDNSFGCHVTEFLTALQEVAKMSEGDIYETLRRIAIKIHTEQWPYTQCQKVTDIIISFLNQMKPDKKMEDRCTRTLIAVGLRSPNIIVEKLLGTEHQPPRSLLLAAKEICDKDGPKQCIDQLWDYILRLLQMSEVEEDMLAVYEVLRAVVSCVQRQLNVKASAEDKLAFLKKAAIKSCDTFQLLRYHWPQAHKPEVVQEILQLFGNLVSLMPVYEVKDETDWLIGKLTDLPINMTPYIQECLFQVLDAVLISKTGGFDKDSQVDSTIFLLFKLLHISGRGSDRSLIWRSFMALITLHSDRVVHSLFRYLKFKDPATLDLTLTVFTKVLRKLPKTDEVRSELLQSVIALIQRDIRSVRFPLLQFIEVLNRHDYLENQDGNHLIYHLIRLTFTGRSVKRSFRRECIEVLKTISLPQLITVVCQPKNCVILVPMSTILLQKALLAYSLGNIPYLSSSHLKPTQFISPQKLLFHLVIIASKPYREKGLGVSALKLLGVLCPMTLDPDIHSSVMVFCSKKIPELLYILRDNNRLMLNKKEWAQRLLKFSRLLLMIINDEEWLERLLLVIMEKINCSDTFYLKNKAFLYKFFGSTLRVSRGKQLVNTMVFSLLQTSHQEPRERKGIAVALSVVSRSHLETVMEQLQACGAVLTDQNSSPILNVTKDHQQREWGLVCNTIYSSFSRVIRISRGNISKYANDILAFAINTYQDSVIVKDTNMKLDYLDALAKMTTALCKQPLAPGTQFPSAQGLECLMVTILKEEPMEVLSSYIRVKAINLIISIRKLEDFSGRHEETAAVLQTCLESVLCLPSPSELFQEPFEHLQSRANADLYKSTLESLLRLMKVLVEQRPSGTEEFLEGFGRWINSSKHYEREWALWIMSQLLSYVAEKQSFKKEIKFTKLELLVKLLALRCYDEMDKVCILCSQAVYHLYHILQQQEEMKRKKMGLEREEKRSVSYNAYSFYKNSVYNIGRNSAANIAKAFAEFFTKTQLTNLVLDALKSVTDSMATVSLPAAQLMSAIMKERGGDVLQAEEVARGILSRLDSTLEPRIREELLQAMCWLAGHSTSTVVALLLSQPLPWDRTQLVTWKAFGADRETTVRVLQLLASILAERDPYNDSREMDIQPVAVSCALLAILAGSVCQEAVQKLYPRLLLGLLCGIYWTAEKNSPEQGVLCSKMEDSKSFDPLSCTLQALRALIVAVDYTTVVTYADEEHCWEILSSPESFHLGVMTLSRAIVKNCPQQVISEILDLVMNMLESQDPGQKLLARSVYAELLCHRAVAEALGQESLNTFMKYIIEPNVILKEIGVIGLRNLALHPKTAETLSTMTHVLKELPRSTPRLKIHSMKTYRNIVITTKGVSKDVFRTTSKELRLLLNDEKREVRLSATSSLGDMMKTINQYKQGSSFKKEIRTFLVPLLLNLQEDDIDMVKVCAETLEKWCKIIKWKSLTSKFKHANLSNHIQVIEDTIKRLVRKRKMDMLGMLFLETFEMLKSPQPFQSISALRLIGIILKSLPTMHLEDSEVIKTALETANESVPDIQQLTAATLANLNLIPAPKLGKNCLRILYRLILRSNRSRLFKSIDENESEKKSKSKISPIRAWWQKHRGTVKDSSQV
ncbi:maestro heat-like repeat-containing protein family member 1 [Sorex araneus]|uniref:maestro heat-like repeat-containing protein family member 1 n=1 Tax=Sorex araneus TaxID=42254 RepID=UPI0024334885|nr:maestro heat-like repeat-containing protein family member 1 [Sorex araneus]